MYEARKEAREAEEETVVLDRINPAYVLPINVLLCALKEASSRSKQSDMVAARRDALEWLLTYDVVEGDERGFSCGFCIAAAILAGIDFPEMDKFRNHIHRLARRAGFDVVYTDLPESLTPHSGERQPSTKGMPEQLTRRDKVPCGAAPVLLSREEVA
jgi:hypothetical protein